MGVDFRSVVAELRTLHAATEVTFQRLSEIAKQSEQAEKTWEETRKRYESLLRFAELTFGKEMQKAMEGWIDKRDNEAFYEVRR